MNILNMQIVFMSKILESYEEVHSIIFYQVYNYVTSSEQATEVIRALFGNLLIGKYMFVNMKDYTEGLHMCSCLRHI